MISHDLPIVLYTMPCTIHVVEAAKLELSEPVKTVIEESLSSLTGGLSPKDLNQQFLQKYPDSLDHLIHGEPLSFCAVKTSVLFVMQELKCCIDYSQS